VRFWPRAGRRMKKKDSDGRDRLNPVACAMAVPPRSKELKIVPCEETLDYGLRIESTGSTQDAFFIATRGDLIHFRDTINKTLNTPPPSDCCCLPGCGDKAAGTMIILRDGDTTPLRLPLCSRCADAWANAQVAYINPVRHARREHELSRRYSIAEAFDVSHEVAEFSEALMVEMDRKRKDRDLVSAIFDDVDKAQEEKGKEDTTDGVHG